MDLGAKPPMWYKLRAAELDVANREEEPEAEIYPWASGWQMKVCHLQEGRFFL